MEYTREGYEALKKAWDEEITKAYESGDEHEQLKATILSNKEIHDYWSKLRTLENGLTIDQTREKYLGRKVRVADGYKYDTRTLKEDDKGFYVLLQGSNARVEYDPVFRNFKVKHYEPRK